MIDVRQDFQERTAEVMAYMKLVEAIEQAASDGSPILRTRAGTTSSVDPLQQKILCGGVYLHLYNLVEATLTRCIASIEEAASQAKVWRAGDLSLHLRREWVRSIAKTHETLTTENRLNAALEMCDHLVSMIPITLEIRGGAGGNWDDEQIYRLAHRLGMDLQIDAAKLTAIKRPVRDNRGALSLVKFLRNKLAHGEMSFAECGEGQTASELEGLVKATVSYLDEVISCFQQFVQRYEFLEPQSRPDLPPLDGG